MENKKLGILLISIAIIVGVVIFYYNSQLTDQAQEAGCYSDPDCLPIEQNLSLTHIAIGIFSFILALGFYLLFFNKTDEKIMRRLEEEKERKIGKEKFEYILKGLDSYEKKVMKIIREQDGITQSTLRIRADMSKAKLSYVLSDLEKRNLIKRVQKGKTLAIFLKV